MRYRSRPAVAASAYARKGKYKASCCFEADDLPSASGAKVGDQILANQAGSAGDENPLGPQRRLFPCLYVQRVRGIFATVGIPIEPDLVPMRDCA